MLEILNSEFRIGYWLNSSNRRNSNWKPKSCLIPTLSLDDPLTQPWEILSEATPSRAPEITIKPKLLPWYEMMTTSRTNSDGGGVKAWEVTLGPKFGAHVIEQSNDQGLKLSLCPQGRVVHARKRVVQYWWTKLNTNFCCIICEFIFFC